MTKVAVTGGSARLEERWSATCSSTGTPYDRFAQVKAKYDPDNTFRVNQNIQPNAA